MDNMRSWHGLHLDKNGHSYGKSDDENNIVYALNKVFSEVKASKGEELKRNICILLHLIGDLHQPLHTGYKEDIFGLKVNVDFRSKELNLHTLWDIDIIKAKEINLDSCMLLYKTLSKEEIEKISRININEWINQSHQILKDVYSFKNKELDEEYINKSAIIIEKQLLYAGIRLASVLNKYFNKDYVSNNETSIKTLRCNEAIHHIGSNETVCGKLIETKYVIQSKTLWINFCMVYPDNMFSAVVKNCQEKSDIYNYIQTLKEKYVCVTGLIKEYNGRANIEITGKEQILIKE